MPNVEPSTWSCRYSCSHIDTTVGQWRVHRVMCGAKKIHADVRTNHFHIGTVTNNVLLTRTTVTVWSAVHHLGGTNIIFNITHLQEEQDIDK